MLLDDRTRRADHLRAQAPPRAAARRRPPTAITLPLVPLALVGAAVGLGHGDAVTVVVAVVGAVIVAVALAVRDARHRTAVRRATRALVDLTREERPPDRRADDHEPLLLAVESTVQTVEAWRREWEQLAGEDALTGLLNRRAGHERLRTALSLVDRGAARAVVALVDVDRFKRVNDRGGHVAGDELLVAIAHAVRRGLREHDWAARWGGDELLLTLVGSAHDAELALERIRRAVEGLQVRASDGSALCATVSIGFTELQPFDDVSGAIVRADDALYEAKRAGRNRVARAAVPWDRAGG